MAGSKEIRNKIKSVQNTRKITKAMEMVAASKMKKAQERMRASRPYVERALQIALPSRAGEPRISSHPFLVRRDAVSASERSSSRRTRASAEVSTPTPCGSR